MSHSAPDDAGCATLLTALAQALERGQGLDLPADEATMARCLRRAAALLAPEPTQAPPSRPADRARPQAFAATLYADGGARGNPGPAGAGAVIYDQSGAQIAALSRYLGQATNNVAEYQALLMGLEAALELGVGQIEVRLDSELLVKQLGGQYQVKAPHLKPLFQKAKALLQQFADAHIVHVRREQNGVADGLANQAMDRRAN